MDRSEAQAEGVIEIGTVSTPYGDAVILRGNYPEGGAPFVHLVDIDYNDIATLSVNIPEENNRLERDEFFVKGWSENEHLVPLLLATGLFEDTGRKTRCGYVQAQVWRFR